jgi:hypothetical protein
VLAIGIAAVLTHLTLGPIEIHGEAEWIMRDPAIKWCCGPRECSVVPVGSVLPRDGGWFVPGTGQRFKLGDPYTYWSKDDRMWWCRVKGSNGEPMQGVVQCLFVPKLGS